MLKFLSEIVDLLFAIPLLLLGGLFKLLDRLTGAVPGTPTEDRGATLFVILVLVYYVVFFAVLWGAPHPK